MRNSPAETVLLRDEKRLIEEDIMALDEAGDTSPDEEDGEDLSAGSGAAPAA